MNTRYLKQIFTALAVFFAVHFAQAQVTPTPGGVVNDNYTWAVWLSAGDYVPGTWPNRINHPVGNFVAPQQNPTIVTGRNFNPAVQFRSGGAVANAFQRLLSQNNYVINAGDNITIIFVMERSGLNPGHAWDNLISFSDIDQNAGLWWYNTGSRLRWDWPGGTDRNFTTAFNTRANATGILTMSNANVAGTVATNGIIQYVNGGRTASTATAAGSTNQLIQIASGRLGSHFGMDGDIQEVIIVRAQGGAAGANHMNIENNLQRIHSYLAIKYGIHLNNDLNYLNSEGTVIWDRTRNAGFNNFMFGVGRDDITRLNQVQSRNHQSDILTLFKGNSTLQTLNNRNSTAFASDRSHLVLGVNATTVAAVNSQINANVVYNHNKGTSFLNFPNADFRLSYRTQLTYKAQVTVDGVAGGSHTVNMQINNGRPQFVIVSADPDFPAEQTRIYPINNRIALNVLVYDGDYISFAGFEPTPGGVGGFALDLWIDGNNSTNTSWPNRVAANFTLERGSPTAPVVRNSQFNFHQEIFFGNTTHSKLRTTVNYPITANDTIYAFVVSQTPGSGEQTLLAFRPTTTDVNARRASLQWNGTNARTSWSTVAAWQTVTNAQNFGIMGLNVVNSGAGTFYFNGTAAPNFTTGNVASIAATQLFLGNGDNRIGSAASNSRLPFNGAIQEVIVMRGNGQMTDTQIAQIHSYLAIKYGITIQTDYFASDETVVWDRAISPTFNNHIFGIGRDDLSGLDQRQARSASNRYVTIFIGNDLATLNSQNTGKFDADRQFLMIGSDGGHAIQLLSGFDHTGFVNGSITMSEPYNIKSAMYRAQLTGFTAKTVNLQAPQDFMQVLVSTSPDFPRDGVNTRFYNLNMGRSEITLGDGFVYFKFVGFAPGPGGVTRGLQMWLRADDPIGIQLNHNIDSRYLEGLSAVAPHLGTENVPAVTSWSDLAREVTFRHLGGTLAANSRRVPVLEHHHPEMNFQPAVRFWTHLPTGTSSTHDNIRSAFLVNDGDIMNETHPEHSVMMVVNNDLTGGVPQQNILWFSGNVLANNITAWRGPGFALERVETAGANFGTGRGRFRGAESGGAGETYLGLSTPANRLFIPNTTSILTYNVQGGVVSGTSTLPMYFRFNGREEARNVRRNPNYDMTRASILGGGNNNMRATTGMIGEVIIFNRIPTGEDTRRVESYLALKYGITLRPQRFAGATDFGADHNPNVSGRFDYIFSNNRPIWLGETGNANDIRFYNNIAAVIRDDAARIHNRQAMSTDVGSVLYMGIAEGTLGANLTDDGRYLGQFQFDNEAVVWGSEAPRTGTAPGAFQIQMQEEDCGEFDFRFRRVWRVLNRMQDGRPAEMIVGLRNNMELTFGKVADAETNFIYQRLADSDLYLIIAASPDDLTETNFNPLRVIPMTNKENAHQALYTFSKEETFITFGFRTNASACFGTEENSFTGTNTFNWNQWTSRTNRSNTFGVNVTVNNTLAEGEVGVTSTQVQYGSNMRPATVGFPRATRSALEVRQRGRNRTSMEYVTITINFNYPVVPEFQISGIDGRIRSFDQVTVTGSCFAVGGVRPQLTHVGRSNVFQIEGNRASATANRGMAQTNRDGTVNVEFTSAVTQVVIRYRVTGHSLGTQSIFISPLTLRSWDHFLPPPVNTDGLSFLKRASSYDVTTCETVTYSFFIQNTNCHELQVRLTDNLPEGMVFVAESLSVGEANSEENNPELIVNDFAGTRELLIENLIIPPSSTLRVMVAAEFKESAQSGQFKNQAQIGYYRWTIDGLTGAILESTDWAQQDMHTIINATRQERQETVSIEATTNRSTYRENNVIVVTYTISNPNDAIENMFLDVDFNDVAIFNTAGAITNPDELFRFIAGSLVIEGIEDATFVTADWTANDPFFAVAGAVDGSIGFTLPSGESSITFRLQVPSIIEFELDDAGNETTMKQDLVISHDFHAIIDDPCISRALDHMSGKTIIPYRAISHIITNRHVTPILQRR